MIKPKAIFLKDKRLEPNVFAVFSKTVTLKGRETRIRVSACSYYRLRINGEFVCHGPARAGHYHARVDEYDVSDSVKNGENLFEFQVASYGGAFGTVNDDTNEEGFLYAGIIENGVTVAGTDESWQGAIDTRRDRYAPRHSHCRQVTEVWHLDRDAASSLLPCEVEEVPAPTLIERGVPYPTFEKISAGTLADFGSLEYDADKPVPRLFYYDWNEEYAKSGERPGDEDMKYRRAVTGRTVTRKNGLCFGEGDGAAYAVYDMQDMYCGFIDFTVTSGVSCCVDIVYSDRLEPDGDVNAQIGYNTVIRVYCPAGRTHFTSFEPYAMRYIKAVVRCGAGFEINGIGIISYAPEDVHSGTFLSSDEDLNRIYEAARRTLLLNTLDIFMDCPDRERGGWLCDSLWTGRAAALMLGDPSVERAMIENFMFYPGEECYHGFFPQCYPAKGDFKNGALTTWSFWFVVEIGEYYKRTGDRELIDRCRHRLDVFFEGVRGCCGEHGLFDSHGAVFVDWSLSNEREYVYPISAAANVEYACALETYDMLYDVPEARAHAERIRKTLREVALDRGGYDPRYILHDSLEYKDGKLRGKPFYSESAQYTMLWGGLFTKEECPGLIDAAVHELGPVPRRKPPKLDIGSANMFIGLCIRLDMLSRLGYVDVMLEEIKYLCGIMLKKGPGTLWETVSGQSSRCHGFMSHIGVLLSRDVLGLDIPEAFPEKRVRVAPHPGALSSASGSVNTPDGLISVSWSNNGRGFELRVNAPRSYRVDLILPEEVRGHSSVTVNGEPVTGREFEFHGIKAPLTVKTQK